MRHSPAHSRSREYVKAVAAAVTVTVAVRTRRFLLLRSLSIQAHSRHQYSRLPSPTRSLGSFALFVPLHDLLGVKEGHTTRDVGRHVDTPTPWQWTRRLEMRAKVALVHELGHNVHERLLATHANELRGHPHLYEYPSTLSFERIAIERRLGGLGEVPGPDEGASTDGWPPRD